MVICEVFSYVTNSFTFALQVFIINICFLSFLFYLFKASVATVTWCQGSSGSIYFLYLRAYQANRLYLSVRRVRRKVTFGALIFALLIFMELIFVILPKLAEISFPKLLQIRSSRKISSTIFFCFLSK